MNRRNRLIAATLLTSAALALSTQGAERQQADRPTPSLPLNIVLIMADDLGYECIGANGCDDYKTPVLDRLASEGVRFTNCFANPLCTPTRAKLMTGRYNVRNYVGFGVLDRNEKTFAHAFKDAGYTTCIAGKWQLGKEKDSPQHFGFDQACLWQHLRPARREGTANDSRFSNPRLEINGEPVDYDNGEYGPDVCAEFICDFIEENTRSAGSGHEPKPFLAYYPMILTHCPFTPPPDTDDWDASSPGSRSYKGDARYFGDMVHHMDKLVGRIVATLEEHKLLENTLLIFTGDNGTDPPVVTSLNGQKIAGGKRRMNDHGTRVPLIVSYPGNIQKGLVSDELIDFADFFPTICEASGIEMPGDRPMDGVSFWSTLQGKSDRDKPWAYIWFNGQVLARTKSHMLRRKTPGGRMEFIDCSTPYKELPLDIQSLRGEELATCGKLADVLQELDKARPQKLREQGKQSKRNKRI